LSNESPSKTPILCKRKRADWLGLPRYYTGKPCKNGHIAERQTDNGNCIVCVAEKRKAKYWADPEVARKKAVDARLKDPEKHRARKRELYQADPERHKEYAKRHNRIMVESFTEASNEPQTCGKCGETKPADEFSIDRYRKSGRKHECRACVSKHFAKWMATDGYTKRLKTAKSTRDALKKTNPRLRWAQMAKNAANARAKAKGIEMSLTVDWLLENAPDKCPLLEIPLNYTRSDMGRDSPAVDRKDNLRGYSMDNCWVISSHANRIKTDATVSELLTFAKNLEKLMG